MTNRMEWQPIETAPKDGTLVLFWSPLGGVFAAQSTAPPSRDELRAINKMIYDFDGSWANAGHAASHWMPLPPPPLVDHPRPTTPVVDHEGGESDPQDEARPRRAKAMDELIAGSADEIFTPLETKQATRISELEAEVERLKVQVEDEREACAKIADKHTNGPMYDGDQMWRGGYEAAADDISVAIRARSTAMNKGGE